jgi:hypothetical protein
MPSLNGTLPDIPFGGEIGVFGSACRCEKLLGCGVAADISCVFRFTRVTDAVGFTPIAYACWLTDSSPKKIVWRLSPEVLRCVGKAEAKISDLINQVCALL